MRTSPFTFALNTSTLRCGDAGLHEKIDAAADAGFEGIEPWIAELDAYRAEGGSLDALSSRFRDRGLEVVNLIGFFEWGVDDEKRREEGMAEARRCFELAAQLDCPRLTAPPKGLTEVKGADLFSLADRYANLLRIGREYGVTPVLEFWGVSNTLGTLGEALLVAAECGEPNACLLGDVFHMYKNSGHFEGLRHLGPDRLGLFHINDYPADPPRTDITDADRVYPGDGIAPLNGILNTLADIGYRGVLSLELFNASYWKQDAHTVAETGYRKLRECVETALAP